MNDTQTTTHTRRRLQGIVTSDKMQNTVTVSVARYLKHPKYQKFIKRMKKYHAHDEGNTCKEGDSVTIEEAQPISKTKRFTVVKEAK